MAFTDSQIKKVIRLIDEKLPFALYSLPGEYDARIDDGCDNVSSAGERFVFNAWGKKCKDERYISSVNPCIRYNNTLPSEISRSEYITRVSEVISALDHKDKAVISRVVALHKHFSPKEIIDVADKYFSRNPHAFRCLFYDVETGIWLTATPELLLETDWTKGILHTMALAGTKPVEDTLTEWNEKNMAEQQIVTDYIVSRLCNLGFTPTVKGPETASSGKVCHLKTEISCQAADISGIENIVLDEINPTPAVAGSPLDKAFDLISSAEIHPRELYAGYVGVKNDNGVRLFVNLRTCRFTFGGCAVYVGGGITKYSKPEEEWNETCLKASGLMDLLLN